MAVLLALTSHNMGSGTIRRGWAVAMHASGLGFVPATASPPLPAVGLVSADTTPGQAADIQIGGLFTQPNWSLVVGTTALIPGKFYFLDPVFPGHYSTLPPVALGQINQVVIQALTTVTANILVAAPILL